MIRTQIQLTEKQSRRLKRMALEQDVSVAELIRRSVDSYVRTELRPDSEKLRQRAMEAVGKYASGSSDVSVDHDRYLADAYRDWQS